MKKTRPIFFIAFILFSIINLVNGQENLWFHELNTRDGLLGDFHQHIFQDSEGFIWISSMSGLNRFDGQTVMPYYSQQGNKKSLLEENILGRFVEDNEKNIWFGTTNAIHRYNRNADDFSQFEIRDAKDNSLKNQYRVLGLEKDSLLWVKVDDGLGRFNTISGGYENVVSDTVYFRYFLDKEKDGKSVILSVHIIGMKMAFVFMKWKTERP